MGLSSWRDILRQVASATLRPDQLGSVFHLLQNAGSEYDVADVVAQLVGRPLVERQIIVLLRAEQARISASGGLHELTTLLRTVGKNGIVTTNWDTLLPRITGYQPLTWPTDAEALASAMRQGEGFVLYLHGNLDNPPLVITRSDCERQAKSFEKSLFRLETVLAVHMLTVIGSSFPDEHLNQLYIAASRIAGQNSRLRVVLMRADDARAFRRTHPSLAIGTTEVTYADYAGFLDALRDVASRCDTSARIAEIASIRPNDEGRLFEIVSAQPYNFSSSSNLRERYLESVDPSALLDTSAKIILSASRDSVTSGLLATMLSTVTDSWRADPSLLIELARFSDRALDSEPALIGIVEPLVFAIARHNMRQQHAKYLRTVMHDQDWRIADISRMGQYYEDTETQIRAMKRHNADQRRDGILRANDIVRLMNMLTFVDAPVAERDIIQLLDASIETLRSGGQDTLAKQARAEVDIIQKRKLRRAHG